MCNPYSRGGVRDVLTGHLFDCYINCSEPRNILTDCSNMTCGRSFQTRIFVLRAERSVLLVSAFSKDSHREVQIQMDITLAHNLQDQKLNIHQTYPATQHPCQSIVTSSPIAFSSHCTIQYPKKLCDLSSRIMAPSWYTHNCCTKVIKPQPFRWVRSNEGGEWSTSSNHDVFIVCRTAEVMREIGRSPFLKHL